MSFNFNYFKTTCKDNEQKDKKILGPLTAQFELFCRIFCHLATNVQYRCLT